MTFWVFVALASASLVLLFFLSLGDSAVGFWGFLLTFMLLFAATGVGNASTFQMIPVIFRIDRERAYAEREGTPVSPAIIQREAEREAAAVIGFTSAIAAYGAFFIPKSFGSSIALSGGPEAALYGFLLFYILCIVVTWMEYAGRNAEMQMLTGRKSVDATRPDPAVVRREQIMSQFIDRLMFFKKYEERFSGGHGVVTNESRAWEDGYRQRWQHDKIVRSTHGTNCTGSCSWKIYVKNGLVTWETQQTDYPRTRPEMPNHEPRGCSRGASYSWYLYSGNRLKYPMIRGRLLKLWREARKTLAPVEAWASIVEDPDKARHYKSIRGMGGFVRSTWPEVNEIIAAANVYTIKTYGPDRVVGFSPIPAMSMISYAAGTRYLSLIGGTCMSFYDWYCDLPPSSPQTFGEQTDVPESADWYNAHFLILWGSNVPQTRTPDAHFYTEVRYKGAKSVVVSPDYSEAAKFADLWLHPQAGTDAALAMAIGHVILKEFHVERQVAVLRGLLPALHRHAVPGPARAARRRATCPAGCVRAADFADGLGEANNPDWKTVAIDELSGEFVVPQGSIGFRWGEQGKWNLEHRNAADGAEIRLRLSPIEHQRRRGAGAVPLLRRRARTNTSRAPTTRRC